MPGLSSSRSSLPAEEHHPHIPMLVMQAVVPRDYYSQLSDRTNRTLLEVGMVETRGWLPMPEQLRFKYALSVDGNTASTRLAMLLASDQVGCSGIGHLLLVGNVP